MKKALAIVICIVMMLSLCVFVYANEGVTTVTINAVHGDEEPYATWTWTSEEEAPGDITVRTDDLLNVSVTLANGEKVAFFTYAKGAEEFGDENVQFLNQGKTGNVIAEFNPRDTFVIDESGATGSVGEFTATISGDGMDAPMVFHYTVTGSEPVNAQAVESTDGNHYGMRFVFRQFHNADDSIGKYGAFIVPFSLFDEGDTYDTTNLVVLEKDITNGETYSADLLDIPLAERETEIFAISYMEFEDEVTGGRYVYGKPISHSVSEWIAEQE